MIDEVLNFAKLETGRTEYRLEAVRVAGLLASLDVLIQPQIHTKGLEYLCDPPPHGLTVHGDYQKVQQILLNLISNAIKFTPSGGSVTLFTEVTDSTVRIHVRDTGRGIPRDKIETVFEPFVQVDRRLTREFGGVGLGLAISRELAQGMGGTLSVMSEVGVGSTFTLMLSLALSQGMGMERTANAEHRGAA